MIDKVSSGNLNISSQIGSKPQASEPVVQKSADVASVSQQVKTPASQQIKTPQEAQNVKFTEDNLKEIVKGMNDFLTPNTTGLKFEFHEKLNEYYVTLIDEKTEEVIKEIPSKKLLDFYAAMTESIGWLVDKKV